jgi:hypothetical protein
MQKFSTLVTKAIGTRKRKAKKLAICGEAVQALTSTEYRLALILSFYLLVFRKI